MTYSRRDIGRIVIAGVAGFRLLEQRAWGQAASIGVGARPEPGAEMIIDGTRQMLD